MKEGFYKLIGAVVGATLLWLLVLAFDHDSAHYINKMMGK